MIGYFRRTVGAHVKTDRALYLLTVGGVALGVASVMSIQIINRSALAAFSGTVNAISAGVDLTVKGKTPNLSEELLIDVLETEGVKAAWPLYRTSVSLEDHPDELLDVVGLDFYMPVDIPFRTEAAEGSVAIQTRGWIAVTPAFAEEMKWEIGDTVRVTSGTRRVELVIGALVDFQRANPLASRKLAVMDIAQAQGLLGGRGTIHQIDIISDADNMQELARRLSERLGSSVYVITPEQRREEAAGLLEAFRLNLTALSSISLFVGIFLVYSSTQAALIRRRTEFGVLRSLGASRNQVLWLILGEVGLLGVFGVILGLPLGYLAAVVNVDVVSGTLTNLYLLNEIERLDIPSWIYLSAATVGVGGAVVGATAPALDMARRDARSLLAAFTLHEQTRSIAPKLFVAGVTGLGLTGLWYALLGHQWRMSGFVLAIAVVGCMPLMAPLFVQRVSSGMRVNAFDWRYSVRTMGASLQTTSVAVAALTVAVSMLVGITLMVGSFRQTLILWMESTVRADLYITTPSWQGAWSQATLGFELVDSLRRFPGVREVDRLRAMTAYTGERRVALLGVDFRLEGGEGRFALLRGNSKEAYASVSNGAVLVSEPLARKAHLSAGDSIPVAVPSGDVLFPIAGVYYDYGNEAGTIAADYRTVGRWFGDGGANSVGVYVDPNVDADRMIDDLQRQFGDHPLLIRSNRRLRREALAIFDQTFAVTRLLQLMSLVIAATGITLTLLVLARERISELALYRSLGAARRQLFTIFVGKGVAMTVLGLVAGIIGGGILSAVLILVINRAFFGWTIQFHLPWSALAGQFATILGAAIVASIYPAMRASRVPGTELSREDV